MDTRSTGAATTPVQVTARGDVSAGEREYAAEKVGHVLPHASQPVLHAHVVLHQLPDPARENSAHGEAMLDVNGTPVRAHVAAAHMREAIDLLADRLRRLLVQHADRVRTRHRWTGEAGTHEWRHGDLARRRTAYFPRPAEERQVIRRKTFALEPLTPDEAAYDMDLLGHDFHLFTDLATGGDALIYRRSDGRFGVQGAVSAGETQTAAASLVVEGPAPEMTQGQATAHLVLAGEPFVFYRDASGARGTVLYVRYDGHYGLITPA